MSAQLKAYRKKRRPGNRGRTKAEDAYMLAVKKAGCICCIAQGFRPSGDPESRPMVEAHHLLSGGIRIGHHAIVGLCQYHHRDVLIVNGWDRATHRRELGPSLLSGSVAFHEHFGSDADLLAMQSWLMEQAA